MIAKSAPYTPQDLLEMPDGKHFELVDSQLVEHEMSLQACEVAAHVIAILVAYIRDVDEYLAAGVRLVWVFNPRGQTIQLFRRGGTPGWVDAKGELSGEDVIPGFRHKAADFFRSALPQAGNIGRGGDHGHAG